jgi:RNA polymerase sigma factor (sigma-70 family)
MGMSYGEIENTQEESEGRGPSDIDLTGIYLRELGTVPLLDRQEEVELATKLEQARKDYARAAMKLPAECRAQVLGNGKARPRAREMWTMQRIESCHEGLRSYARGNPTLRRNPTYISLADAKNRMDRSRNAMINANLRLVAHVAKKFCKQGMPFMDLVQEGNIGLMKAVEKFEYQRGHKFSTYAFWWIKQAITRAIADKSRTIRIPVHLMEKVRKVQRASRELEKTLGRQPKAGEIAQRIQVPVTTVIEILGVDSNN